MKSRARDWPIARPKLGLHPVAANCHHPVTNAISHSISMAAPLMMQIGPLPFASRPPSGLSMLKLECIHGALATIEVNGSPSQHLLGRVHKDAPENLHHASCTAEDQWLQVRVGTGAGWEWAWGLVLSLGLTVPPVSTPQGCSLCTEQKLGQHHWARLPCCRVHPPQSEKLIACCLVRNVLQKSSHWCADATCPAAGWRDVRHT